MNIDDRNSVAEKLNFVLGAWDEHINNPLSSKTCRKATAKFENSDPERAHLDAKKIRELFLETVDNKFPENEILKAHDMHFFIHVPNESVNPKLIIKIDIVVSYREKRFKVSIFGEECREEGTLNIECCVLRAITYII